MRRVILIAMYLLIVVCWAVGIWGLFPYLAREHRRLEPWQWPLLWLSDVTTLLWFTWFVYAYALRGKPLDVSAASPGRVNRTWLLAFLSTLLALLIDLLVTLASRVEEERLFADAVIVAGQVDAIRVTADDEKFFHELQCRYTDRQGRQHEAIFILKEKRGRGFARPLPAETITALRKHATPFPIQVAYDPDWPARSWLVAAGPHDGNRLHMLSLAFLFLQALALLAYPTHWAICRQLGKIPWYFELVPLFPVTLQALALGGLGLAYRFEGGVFLVS